MAVPGTARSNKSWAGTLPNRGFSGSLVRNSVLYTFGFFVLLAGLIYGAVLLRVPATWIVIGGLAVNALGIVWMSSYTTQNDPPKP